MSSPESSVLVSDSVLTLLFIALADDLASLLGVDPFDSEISLDNGGGGGGGKESSAVSVSDNTGWLSSGGGRLMFDMLTKSFTGGCGLVRTGLVRTGLVTAEL